MSNSDNTHAAGKSASSRSLSHFTKRLLIVFLGIIVAIFLWRSAQAFLLAFAGFILATLFTGWGRKISAHTPLSYRPAMLLSGFGLLAALAGLVFFLGPKILGELTAAMDALPRLIDRFENSDLGRLMIDKSKQDGPEHDITMPMSRILQGVVGLAGNTIGGISAAVLVLALAFFLAFSPGAYRQGLLTLIPPARRDRAGEVLDACARGMHSWLKGQVFAMFLVAILTSLGLLLVGYPYPLLGGLIAGLLQFIPYIGPFLAAAPVILLGFADGSTMALYAALVMAGVQLLEGNTITPMVFRREVSLPPAFTLLGTVMAGLVFGPLGLIVGTPLVLIILIVYRMLYQHDFLGDKVHIPGSG